MNVPPGLQVMFPEFIVYNRSKMKSITVIGVSIIVKEHPIPGKIELKHKI